MDKIRKYKMKPRNGLPCGRDEKIFSIIAYLVMGFFCIITVIPFFHVMSKGLSSASAVVTGGVVFWPKGLQFEVIDFVVNETLFLHTLSNTVIVTSLGTLISMFATITTAYSLSHTKLIGRKAILLLYIFSMVFYGGIIPAYMVVKALGIIDTYWALILPTAIVQFNMLIVKNYFEGLPESIEESAQIDGAGYWRILFFIVAPIAKPVVATVALLYAINYWNNYFHAVMYTNTVRMQTLQIFLRNLVADGSDLMERIMSNSRSNVTLEGVKAAAVTLSIIPIIAVYPFIQRYFVQGITIGSVKG